MRYWLGQVTHKDDIDGCQDYLILPDDISVGNCNKIIQEAKQDGWNIWEVTHRIPRSKFDGIAKSITESRDFHDIGDGYLADLVESYEVG